MKTAPRALRLRFLLTLKNNLMLRAIIVDDEQKGIQSLCNDLEAFELDVEVLAKCTSAIEGLKAIQKYKPDVVFLDVEMPGTNGFEMLGLVDNIDFEVVFVTAFSSYAIQAFKVSATDFLLKPVDEEDLREAVKKVKNSRKTKGNRFTKEHLEILINNLKTELRNQRFAIPTMEGYAFHPLQGIIYCQAEGSATSVVTTGKKFISGHNLKKFEKRLPKALFERIHSGHIINMEHIEEYRKGKAAYVVMSDGKVLRVAEKRKEHFVNRFKW